MFNLSTLAWAGLPWRLQYYNILDLVTIIVPKSREVANIQSMFNLGFSLLLKTLRFPSPHQSMLLTKDIFYTHSCP